MAVLHVIATPIGNLEDVSHRAVRLLGELEALAAEDTRVTRRLLERYGIARPRHLFACHEHNEQAAARHIARLLDEGTDVGLCTDAGTPGISDPGYRAVVAALEAGHEVRTVPGPSAVPAALAVSGLSAASYTFLGFPPRKTGQRRRLLARESAAEHTLVLFESPHRIAGLLQDALGELGDRRAAICLELTKLHERVERGWLSELAGRFADTPTRGEITVVIAGSNPKFRRAEPGAMPSTDNRELTDEAP